MEIIEAIHGKQAYEILQRKTIDILLTDIKMPFMNGIELIKKAKSIQPNLKIILFSGYSEFGYAREVIQIGVIDYILKPVDTQGFELVISNILNDEFVAKWNQVGGQEETQRVNATLKK